MREWRKTHPLSAEQRKRNNARRYTNVYIERGKLIPQPCEKCGEQNVEPHHHNYDTPLDVTWLCKPCHVEHHRA